MLLDDTEVAVSGATGIVDDRRVQHFYDAERQVGKAIAKLLGAEGEIAWDVYLFYLNEGTWDKGPPTPIAWMHQLSASWANPANLYYGADLVAQLRRTMETLDDS